MPTWNSYRIPSFGQPLQLQQEALPQPRGTEVLVRIVASGVCHSDVHLWEGYFDMGGGRKRPISMGGAGLPLTLGHEIAGEVVSLGPDAIGTKTGENCVVFPWIGCGEPTCRECTRGLEHMCNKRGLGTRVHGGFSDHVLVPHPRYVVPYNGLPAPLAATYACAGLTAYSALKKIGTLGAGGKLLIIGAGGVGMWGIRLAKLITGTTPAAVETDSQKRSAALEHGAEEAIDPAAPNAAESFVKRTGGARAVIDFVGSESSVQFGLAALGKAGHLIIVGLFGGAMQVPIPMFPFMGMTVQGSIVGSLEEMRALLELGRTHAIQPISYSTRPLAQAAQTLVDLKAGRILGRMVLVP